VESLAFKYDAKATNNITELEFEVSEENYLLIRLTEPEMIAYEAS
jgi:hypothetical protein